MSLSLESAECAAHLSFSFQWKWWWDDSGRPKRFAVAAKKNYKCNCTTAAVAAAAASASTQHSKAVRIKILRDVYAKCNFPQWKAEIRNGRIYHGKKQPCNFHWNAHFGWHALKNDYSFLSIPILASTEDITRGALYANQRRQRRRRRCITSFVKNTAHTHSFEILFHESVDAFCNEYINFVFTCLQRIRTTINSQRAWKTTNARRSNDLDVQRTTTTHHICIKYKLQQKTVLQAHFEYDFICPYEFHSKECN